LSFLSNVRLLIVAISAMAGCDENNLDPGPKIDNIAAMLSNNRP
jgi:hypothetical protein